LLSESVHKKVSATEAATETKCRPISGVLWAAVRGGGRRQGMGVHSRYPVTHNFAAAPERVDLGDAVVVRPSGGGVIIAAAAWVGLRSLGRDIRCFER